MSIQLSKRLRQVGNYVPEGTRLLDVGSDHAYLPIALVQNGCIAFAIAGEVVAGPYRSALANVQSVGLENQISVRLADGLAAYDLSDNVSTITICGMGGQLIATILEAGLEKLATVSRLVLQPNNREDDLRRWLENHQFKLVAEDLVEENGKFYEILVAEPGQMVLSERDARFGLFLRHEQSVAFQQKWRLEQKKLEQALSKIPETHANERSAIRQKVEMITEVMHESK